MVVCVHALTVDLLLLLLHQCHHLRHCCCLALRRGAGTTCACLLVFGGGLHLPLPAGPSTTRSADFGGAAGARAGARGPRGRWTTPPATTMDMAAEKGCGYPGRRYGGSDYRFLWPSRFLLDSHSLLVLRSHIPRRVEYCKRVGVGVTVIAEQRHSKLTRQNSAVYLPGKP